MFPSVPLNGAVGGISLVPDVPCPHPGKPHLPPMQTGGGAAERPRPPEAFTRTKKDGPRTRPAEIWSPRTAATPFRAIGFLLLRIFLEQPLGHAGDEDVTRPGKVGRGQRRDAVADLDRHRLHDAAAGLPHVLDIAD